MLVIDDICCGYGDRIVLDGLSLQVESGLLAGLLGPNGSGKSTLMKAVSGILPLRSGTISVCGRPLQSYSARELARSLAVLPQESYTDFEFSVREVVAMGRYPFLERMQREGDHDREIMLKAMSDTGITHLAERLITSLSGGERQRVLLARALAQEPSLLLLDEPTSHLDIRYQMETARLLQHLARERRLAVLGVFHDLNLAARSCDRLLLMKGGRALACGTPEEVLREESIAAAFDLRVAVERSPHTGALRIEPLD